MCQRRHTDDDKVLSARHSLSIREGSDSSLSEKEERSESASSQRAKLTRVHSTLKDSVIEHNDTNRNYQSILAILELKMHPKLYLSSISDMLFIYSKVKWDFCDRGLCCFSFFLHYNDGLEGYQLNVANYRMLQN